MAPAENKISINTRANPKKFIFKDFNLTQQDQKNKSAKKNMSVPTIKIRRKEEKNTTMRNINIFEQIEYMKQAKSYFVINYNKVLEKAITSDIHKSIINFT